MERVDGSVRTLVDGLVAPCSAVQRSQCSAVNAVQDRRCSSSSSLVVETGRVEHVRLMIGTGKR